MFGRFAMLCVSTSADVFTSFSKKFSIALALSSASFESAEATFAPSAGYSLSDQARTLNSATVPFHLV